MLQDGPQLGHVKIMMFLRAPILQSRSVDVYRILILGTHPARFIILANEARSARDAYGLSYPIGHILT